MGEREEVIAFGRTAELMSYGEQRVLKLFRSGLPANLAEEEFRISMAVYQSGLSVPQPFEMLERDGRTGIVYEKAAGMTMIAALARDPGIVEAEGQRMARLHAEIHRCQVEGLPRQKAALAHKITEAKLLSEDETRRITAGIDLLEDEGFLCHGDYHPDNIILGEKEWIIDWMTAMTGSPAADVARTLLLLRTGTLPEELPPPVQELFARLRENLTAAYLQEYMKLSGITYTEIENWLVPVAAARLVEWIPEPEKAQLVKLIRERLQEQP